MISESATTADNAASSSIGISAGSNPGSTIPLNEMVAIT
jgi:hypothetical protein